VGILNPFYEAVAWVLVRLHAILAVPFGYNSGWSWALAIIVLVVLMRLILVPLFVKQMHSQRKMAALAPQVAALRKKYKNDKQTMNQEVMKLYQENGANPLAGCLPLVVQLPVFFALFNVLRAVAEGQIKYGLTERVVYSAQHAHILWATIADRIVTSPLPPWHAAPGVPVGAKIEIGIVVLISATTTFLTVRQSVKRGIGQVGQDPNNPMANSQKYMMYIAPLFALSGLYWQFGLVMYWVTTNVWTLGQQYVLFRNFTPITAGADAASATAPAAKGTGTPGPAGTTVSRGTTTKGTPARAAGSKTPARTSSTRPGAARTGTARTGTARTGTAKASPAKGATASADGATSASKSASASTKASSEAKTATAETSAPATAKTSGGTKASNGQRSASGNGASRNGASGNGASGAKGSGTTTAPRPQVAKDAAVKNGQASSGTERRGLGRLVRSKPEPEPEPEVPATKLVRQQPTRQSRSKRSGKH
jgi:YidC/Oxa1 family membrane protein insertase